MREKSPTSIAFTANSSQEDPCRNAGEGSYKDRRGRGREAVLGLKDLNFQKQSEDSVQCYGVEQQRRTEKSDWIWQC